MVTSLIVFVVMLVFGRAIIRALGFIATVLALLVAVNVVLFAGAFAQNTRTTCYDSGNTRICETFDGMGNVVAKSRCYQSGRDTRCETQSFGGSSSSSSTTILPLPRR